MRYLKVKPVSIILSTGTVFQARHTVGDKALAPGYILLAKLRPLDSSPCRACHFTLKTVDSNQLVGYNWKISPQDK